MTSAEQVYHRQSRRRMRRGFLKIEVLVAAATMVVAMSLASSLVFRVNQIWTDVQQHQFAKHELSNQLDQLTRLTEKELRSRIDKIEPSEACQRSLVDAKIEGEVLRDKLGTRVVLRMNWKRRYAGDPVELAGWLTEVPEEESP